MEFIELAHRKGFVRWSEEKFARIWLALIEAERSWMDEPLLPSQMKCKTPSCRNNIKKTSKSGVCQYHAHTLFCECDNCKEVWVLDE